MIRQFLSWEFFGLPARRFKSALPGFSKDRKFVFQLGIGVFRPAVTSGVFPRAKKIKNMDDIKNLVFSPLEYDVHPFEWVAALVAEYKTLREKAIAAGVEMTDDPGAEYQMLREVSRFCEKASTLNKNYQTV